jgi:nicotinamidase-related amidase
MTTRSTARYLFAGALYLAVGFGLAGALRLPAGLAADVPSAGKPLRLGLQSRDGKLSGAESAPQRIERDFEPRETAILICDLWDKHWCASASRRCGELADKMAPLIEAARTRGVRIIHAPSDTIDFYKDSPARQKILAAPAAIPPVPIERWCRIDKEHEGELPIDDADGGCDDEPQCKNYKAWSREHPAIRVADDDVVSDDGREIYNYLVQQGIKNILYVGVHTNMCVLGRSFGIRQMSREGFQTVLVRDLTDALYNPRARPQVSHGEGTRLVIEHIEKHWCPTTTSAELVRALQ